MSELLPDSQQVEKCYTLKLKPSIMIYLVKPFMSLNEHMKLLHEFKRSYIYSYYHRNNLYPSLSHSVAMSLVVIRQIH